MTIDTDLDLRRRVDGLHAAMESRAVIEQAKGVLMFLYQVEDETAFAILRRWSMHANVKLRELAIAYMEICVRGDLATGEIDGPHEAVRQAMRPTVATHPSTTLRLVPGLDPS